MKNNRLIIEQKPPEGKVQVSSVRCTSLERAKEIIANRINVVKATFCDATGAIHKLVS